MCPQLGRRAVDAAVGRAEGKATRQAGVDRPRGDGSTRVRPVVDGGWLMSSHSRITQVKRTVHNSNRGGGVA